MQALGSLDTTFGRGMRRSNGGLHVEAESLFTSLVAQHRLGWPLVVVSVVLLTVIPGAASAPCQGISNARQDKGAPIIVLPGQSPDTLPDGTRTAGARPFGVAPTVPSVAFDLGLTAYTTSVLWFHSRDAALVVTSDGGITKRSFDRTGLRFGPPQPRTGALGDRSMRTMIATQRCVALSSTDGEIAVASDGYGIAVEPLTGSRRLLILRSGTIALHYRPRRHRDVRSFRDIAWSPDGRWLAFSVVGDDPVWPSDPDHIYEDVWLMRRDGTHLKRLGHGSLLHWSPDSRWLLCTAGFGTQLVVYEIGGGSSILARSEGGQIADAVFEPDGAAIAILGSTDRSTRGAAESGLFLVDLNGRPLRSIEPADRLDGWGLESGLVW